MKKITFFTIVVTIIIINIFSCVSIKKQKEPEDIGLYAFNILKNLSQTIKSDYVNSFLTIEDIRELGRNEEIAISQDTRNDLTSIKKEEWNDDIESDFNELKQDAGEIGLKWTDIEYLDFVYEIEEEDGISICEGELFFKYNEISFSVDVTAVFNGEEYKLIELDSLGKQ